MFKRRRFPVEIILVCVRWYCKYGISYRDVAEMMQERGVKCNRLQSCAGFIAMHLSWKSRFGGIRDTVRPPGEWTRRM
jgi:hypothetical protein